MTPSPLHIALRQLVDTHTSAIYSDEKLINFLSDFSVFNPPLLRHVLKGIVSGGYARGLADLQSHATDWQVFVSESSGKIVRRDGFESRYVVFCFQCLAYGLRLTDTVDYRLVEDNAAETTVTENNPPNSSHYQKDTNGDSSYQKSGRSGGSSSSASNPSGSSAQRPKKGSNGLFFALLVCLIAVIAYAGVKIWKNKQEEDHATTVEVRRTNPVRQSSANDLSDADPSNDLPDSDDASDQYADAHSRYDYVYSYSSSYRGMAKVEQGGKYGLIDKAGHEVVPPVYDYLYSFSTSYGDMMKVEQGGKYGLLDEQGRVVLPVEYDYLYSFSSSYGGLMKVEKGKKLGLVNRNGQVVLPVAYDYIYNVSTTYDGLMRVEQNRLYGLVNKSGEVVLPVKYEYIHSCKNGRAKVTYQGTDMEVDINS